VRKLKSEDKMFMRVEEVAEELEISVPTAYKVIQSMNKELRGLGCFTFNGRIDRKFFYQHFYGTKDYERSD
jgi:hypothetical protein